MSVDLHGWLMLHMLDGHRSQASRCIGMPVNAVSASGQH